MIYFRKYVEPTCPKEINFLHQEVSEKWNFLFLGIAKILSQILEIVLELCTIKSQR